MGSSVKILSMLSLLTLLTLHDNDKERLEDKEERTTLESSAHVGVTEVGIF